MAKRAATDIYKQDLFKTFRKVSKFSRRKFGGDFEGGFRRFRRWGKRISKVYGFLDNSWTPFQRSWRLPGRHFEVFGGGKRFRTLDLYNGLRPEFGKGTPEIYKKLAHKCMNANPIQRPTASELFDIFDFWYDSIHYEIMRNLDIKEKKLIEYLHFKNLSKPINSFIITSLYLSDEENNEDCQDFQLVDLEVSRTLQ
ncbi:hypothetical protein C1645_833436 [Glomus cerebriforme]|uniref:Serine-threonine/tyrosine-protein kinase catalytic domain-containing protein n=1 Tax=Glomus cerebriforme TaxID=658196 RepID=A0A397SLI9_9GLOM|nr:hypothetical protein C1645_833436 [Glomus cerebriforme]